MARGSSSRALYTMLNTFDATIALHVRGLTWDTFTTNKERAHARYAWERQHGTEPWPAGAPLTAATFCIVHDEMSAHAHKMLKTQLQMLDQWRDDYGMLDTSTLTRGAVLDALELMGTRFVLLLGVDAGRMWRTDLSIEKARGRMHLWRDRYSVTLLESPAAVLRASLNGTPFEGRWREDLRVFVERMLANDQAHEMHVLASRCVVCADGADGWDYDAVAACRKHAEKVAKGRSATARKWNDQIEGQGELL